jgi:hypothetical protein
MLVEEIDIAFKMVCQQQEPELVCRAHIQLSFKAEPSRGLEYLGGRGKTHFVIAGLALGVYLYHEGDKPQRIIMQGQV